MVATGLSGPFDLNNETIDAAVDRVSPGAYALGHSKDGTFYVRRVGRADKNLASRLQQQVGDYAEFKASYFPTPTAAFEKECDLFHDFGPPDNKYHPDSPDGLNLKCHRCPALD